jgi:hypothetical protein
MTLRQEYARPRPRAIARRRDQPGRAAAPAHTGPAGISPPRQPGLGAQLPPARPSPRSYPIRPLLPFPAARAHRGKRPPRPAPGTAGVYHRRPAPLDPYLAGCCRRQRGLGPVPVGVLQAALCGEPSRRW